MEDMYKEEYRKPSGDDNEVKFSFKERGTEILEPHDLAGAEEQSEWLGETMSHHGARLKTLHEGRPLIEVDQEGDTIKTTADTTGHRPDVHGIPVPTERQIFLENEIQTLPRRTASQQPRELRLPAGGTSLASGRPRNMETDIIDRNRYGDEGPSWIALENTVSRM